MESQYDLVLPRIKSSNLTAADEWNDEAKAVCKLPRELANSHPLCVTMRSPLPCRKAVETLAIYFRREFKFDFVQYQYRGDEKTARAYLWLLPDWDTSYNAIGACCFRQRKWRNVKYWGLQWIWFHPYERGRGHLTKSWPYFQARFGDFYPEPPLSWGMESFLNGEDPLKLPNAWLQRNCKGEVTST